MKDLEDSVKKALVWEVQEQAVELFVRRWKFRLSLAIGVAVAAMAVVGFSLRPWMDKVAETALRKEIQNLTEIESAAIKEIKHDQAVQLPPKRCRAFLGKDGAGLWLSRLNTSP